MKKNLAILSVVFILSISFAFSVSAEAGKNFSNLTNRTFDCKADVNRDGIIDIKDLIIIRDYISQRSINDTNLTFYNRSDVNLDRKRNILDLIFVRNNFGGTCYYVWKTYFCNNPPYTKDECKSISQKFYSILGYPVEYAYCNFELGYVNYWECNVLVYGQKF